MKELTIKNLKTSFEPGLEQEEAKSATWRALVTLLDLLSIINRAIRKTKPIFNSTFDDMVEIMDIITAKLA